MNKNTLNTAVNARKVQIDRMNTVGAEIMQATVQALNSEPPISVGVFTYGEW